MIYTALTTLSDLLDHHLRSRFNLNEEAVVLSNIVGQDGGMALRETNKIILTLVHMARESVVASAGRPSPTGRALTYPPVNMNLFVLFSAYFDNENYKESLKFLSATISFFQAHPVFDAQNTPTLGQDIEKLSCEIANIDLQSLSHLWGILGGKHMPSILYKIRMVSFQEKLFDTFLNRVGLNPS